MEIFLFYSGPTQTTTEIGTTYAGVCYETVHITYSVNAMTMQYVNLPDWSNAGLEKIAACHGR